MNIKEILNKCEFQFSKSLGQNFITDTNLLSAIVRDADIQKSDTVVEIGAGAGTLTRELAKAAGRVISFEIDRSLAAVLALSLENLDNVQMVFSDILKTSLEEVHKLVGGKYKIVANLPYYITTPIIFHFLSDPNLISLTIMVQKEVADRIVAAANTSDYGALSAQVQVLSTPVLTRMVPRCLFYPEPNVDSAVVRLDMQKKEGVLDYPHLQRTIAAAFMMRRKTLCNNLCAAFSLNKSKAGEIIQSLGFSPTIRGEALDVTEFIALSNRIRSENL